MARIIKRGETYHITFRHGGVSYSRSLQTGDARRADGLRVKLEDTLAHVIRGAIEVPPGSDFVTFLLSGGATEQKVIPAD